MVFEIALWGAGMVLLLGVALYASRMRQEELAQKDEKLKWRRVQTSLD